MIATLDSLLEYLEIVGGKDVLFFDSADDALKAASIVRRNIAEERTRPSITVEARFDKVLLSRR